jgi:hypothetical protein
MKLSLRRTALPLLSLPFFLLACGDVDASDSAEAVSAAETTTPVLWCLAPSDHPTNLEGEVWKLDVSSAFGPPRDRFVERTVGFYWHGPLLSLRNGDPKASWKISAINEVDGTHVSAASEQGTVEIDLTGDPNSEPIAGATGTIRVHPTSGPEEVIRITAGRRCPTLTF